MHGLKVGLVVAPGRFHAGEVEVADIGLEPADTEHRLVAEEILRLVPRKREHDTKYTSGSVLVVGGSPGLTGAVCLAAEAAFRADAGYVAVAVPPASLPAVELRLLEAVKAPLERVDELSGRASALALGPGLGRGDEQRELVRRLLREVQLPAVVDADALFQLQPGEWPAPRVLTPHSGELARLLGEESAWVDAHRLDAVRRAADRFGCIVLLKGADTLVAAPEAGVLVSTSGRPSLATAGTGDVLTGIIGAFLGKGMDPRLAAAAGAYAHGRAAELAPQQVGLVASDVIDALPRALA
jgi:NAD(P)H-hydrate epimerase